MMISGRHWFRKRQKADDYAHTVLTANTVKPHEVSAAAFGPHRSVGSKDQTRLWAFRDEDGARRFACDYADRVLATGNTPCD